MRNIEKYKSKIFIFLFGFLLLGYFLLIWKNFGVSLTNISSIFGYVDYQHNWRGLEEFLSFRVPFKDYFYEYGWFFLAIQSLGYFIFGRNFLAVLTSMFLYMPVLGVILAYFIARNVLKKKLLVFVFLFFVLLFGTNYNYNSARHLVAELSLSFFILYLLESKTKHLFLAGIIGGLAVLTALEYGIALSIAIFLIFLFSFFSRTKLKKYFLSKFCLGQLMILFPYFFWLYIKGALSNYWEFTFGFINNFYYASPCADNFPRLSEIQILAPTSKLLLFNIPIEFLQRLNFYIVFSFFMIYALVLFILLIKNRKLSQNNLVKLSLVFYGLLIFLRTLNTPCVGYFVYGLVPFFLLLTFLIDEIALWSRRRKALIFKALGVLGIGVIFFWFILTEQSGYVIKIFGKKVEKIKEDSYEEEFYSPVGSFIRKDFAEEYQEITDYIIEHSTSDDFLYVYPWGPYNNLTGRKPPNSLTNMLQVSTVGKQFMEMTERELETKKPKFVVINIYNNLGVAHYGKTRGDVARYFSLGYEDGPVFAGEGNIVEKYILENYEPVLKNDLAIIMKQRVEPITIDKKKRKVSLLENWQKENIELQFMRKTDKEGKYKIIGKDASWTLVFENPVKALDISVEFKLDGDFLTKHLSRYFLTLYVLDEKGEKLGETRVLARKTWQIDKIYFNKPEIVKAIKIEIDENAGLVWWLHPYNLAVRKVSFYE